MGTDDQGKSEGFGEGVPGTGGDYIDTNDTEGHRGRGGRIPTADGGPDGGPDDNNRTKRFPTLDGSEEDVEGHLYTGGPSTKGEFAKRAPSDNPHGER